MGLANANAIVKESYDFWKASGFTFEQRCGLLGNEEGETSFRPRAIGDHGEAFGIFQWHAGRADLIRDGGLVGGHKIAGCGIDVRGASHADQLKAALFELQHFETAAYDALKSAKTIEEAIAALVVKYERSASRSRDISRHVSFAEKWYGIFIDDAPMGDDA
jgi:hypothetical protein